MSYDLSFWRYRLGAKLDDRAVYDLLCEGKEVGGLRTLPVARITERVVEAFEPEWVREDERSWSRADAAFQVSTTRQYFRFDCYNVAETDMNTIIDILGEFACPLYDPQVDTRFELGGSLLSRAATKIRYFRLGRR